MPLKKKEKLKEQHAKVQAKLKRLCLQRKKRKSETAAHKGLGKIKRDYDFRG